LLLNTLFWGIPVFIVGTVKSLASTEGFRQADSRMLVRCAEGWVGFYNRLLRATCH